MTAEPGPRAERLYKRLKWGAILAGAVLLAWQVVRYSVVAALAPATPTLALALRPGAAPALITQADQRLNAPLRSYERARARAPKGPPPEPPPPPSRKTLAEVQAWVRTALIAEPLSPAGFRILGQIAAIRGDKARAARLMDVAANLSIRETAAVLWRLNHRLEVRELDGALEDANALLHTRPDLGRLVLPVLARISELPEGREKLVRLLAARPPWRSTFFSVLPGAVRNPQSPLALYLALAETTAPPSEGELDAYVRDLIRRKRYSLAYYTWLQFLPPARLARARFPYNGDFLFDPSGLPFDWQIRAPSGAWAQISHVPASRGNRALVVEFFGRRAPFRHVSQTLLLGPGAYRLAGRTKADLRAVRGLVWRLYCRPSGKLIAETPPVKGRIGGWEAFETRFVVPRTGCPAQLLRLELIAHAAVEEKARGEAWFDDLRVMREAPVATNGG